MVRQIDKRLDVVRHLAGNLRPGEYITNKGLETELCNRYPEFKGHPNPIIAADFCANSISGYSGPWSDATCERSHNPILFRIARNRYVRYEALHHGSWVCRLINGKKTVIRKNQVTSAAKKR